MPEYLIITIAISAFVVAFGIYVESMLRHARATKIAERERRKALERRASPEWRQTAEGRQQQSRHRSRRRSRRRDR
jgi:hypothetical protein